MCAGNLLHVNSAELQKMPGKSIYSVKCRAKYLLYKKPNKQFQKALALVDASAEENAFMKKLQYTQVSCVCPTAAATAI